MLEYYSVCQKQIFGSYTKSEVMMMTLAELISTLMKPEIYAEFLVSMFFGLLFALISIASPRVKRFFINNDKELSKPDDYQKRLSDLMGNLTQASEEVDKILGELSQVANDRGTAINELEQQMLMLEQQESQLQKRIQDLQDVPIPVAEHFATIIQTGEKRSAWRDYILFGAGVIVSIIITVIIG